jgi:hypothetical protein
MATVCLGSDRPLLCGLVCQGKSAVTAALVDEAEATAVVMRGRDVWRVRAHARTSFYPCRTLVSGTTCSMRAKCAGNAPSSRRPIFVDGRVAATRGQYGRIDLAS